MARDIIADDQRPKQLSDLSAGERLVVWSFRRWVSGTRNWNLVWFEHSRMFGDDRARDTLASFARLVNKIATNAARTLHYHQPCCPCLTEDELRLTAMIGAAQSGSTIMTRHHARGLVKRGAVEDLVVHAVIYGQHLNSCSMTLDGNDLMPPEFVQVPTASAPHATIH
ncbi:MAG: hypothetical protein AAGF58_14215 [Pseudomonadota bacterium]